LIGSSFNKSGKEWVPHSNLGIDTESFGVYPKSFRFNTKNWESTLKLGSWHWIIWCLLWKFESQLPNFKC